MIKRIILLFSFLLVTIVSYSQIQYYKATSYAYKTNEGYGWSSWTDWMKSGILITINLSNDMITTNGNEPQIYKVLSVGEPYVDSSNGRQIVFGCIDHENVRCTIRLRVESNGNCQMYIDYSDIALVFNVKRIG